MKDENSEDLWCHYSDMPSPLAYAEKENKNIMEELIHNLEELNNQYHDFIKKFSNEVLDIFDDEYVKILKGESDEKLRSFFDSLFKEQYGKQFDFNLLSWSSFVKTTDVSKYIKKNIRDRYFKDIQGVA